MDKVLTFAPVIAVFLVGIVEAVAIWRWWPRYWRTGLPVFRRVSKYRRSEAIAVVAERLQSTFRDYLSMRVQWRQLSDTEIAFREWAKPFTFGFRYTPIMRGLVRMDPVSGSIEVIGILNWAALLLLIVFCGLTVILPGPERFQMIMPLFAVGVFSGIYLVQRMLYARITSAVRELLGIWD